MGLSPINSRFRISGGSSDPRRLDHSHFLIFLKKQALSALEKVPKIHSRGNVVAGLPPHTRGEILEAAQRLMGFEQPMSNFFRNPQLVAHLFNQLANIASQSVAT